MAVAFPPPRALDLPDVQILAHYPADHHGFTWHHRILLHRLAPGRWLCLTPDFGLEDLDLAVQDHEVCDRAAPFPARCRPIANIYMFDPITAAEVADHRRRARVRAAIIGDFAMDEPVAARWRYAEPALPHFAEEVPAGLVDDPVSFAALGDTAVVRTPDGAVVKAVRVLERDYEGRRKATSEAAADLRVLGVFHDSNGRRSLSLAEAVPKLTEADQADWPHEGPRVVKEFLTSVCDSGANLVNYHLEWLRASGVSGTSAQAHEHRHICEVLRQAISIDQLDVSNLCCMEQTTRRLVQLEFAVARNPRHPDYSGLSVIADGPVGPDGSARAAKFLTWVTARQKERAEIYKQQRLFDEETHRRDADSSKGGKGDGEDGGKGKGKRRPKGKAKAAAGTDSQ